MPCSLRSTGGRLILLATILASGASFLAASADYLRHFLPGLALFGIGMAAVIPPLTKCALSVRSVFSGSASGSNNSISRVAGLLAVAVLGAVMLTTFSTRLADSITVPGLTLEQRTQILEQMEKLGGITIPETFSEMARQQATAAIHDSFVYGFRWAMAVCAGLALTAAMVSAVTIDRRTAVSKEKEVTTK